MPNPYKYTAADIDHMVQTWWEDDAIVVSLKEYIMWMTTFTEQEFEYWGRTGQIPTAQDVQQPHRPIPYALRRDFEKG